MNTWRLCLEYDGGAYCGWQRQPNCLSIQEVLETQLRQILGGEQVRVIASGRTDAKVHALGQVCSFRSQAWRDPARMHRALNALLPDDIACVQAQLVPAEFHAQYSAIGKLYRYIIRDQPTRSALRVGRVHQMRSGLDLRAMALALEQVVGTHDFTSFRAAGCSAKGAVRTLHSAVLSQRQEEIWLEFYGSGFLRHMVRNLVGSAIEVGEGRFPPEWMGQVLAQKDRNKAGRAAPGCGLYLVRVDYEPFQPLASS